MNVPGYSGWVTPPPEIEAAACQVAPELAPYLLGLASFESNFNPRAVRNTACPNKPGYQSPGGYAPEYSIGLLQLNVCGGLGGSACCNLSADEEARLMDPVYNLSIGANYIRGRLQRGASIYEALSPWTLAREKLAQAGFFNQTPAGCTGTPVNGTGEGETAAVLLLGGLILIALLGG
jgi:hypothetical protein